MLTNQDKSSDSGQFRHGHRQEGRGDRYLMLRNILNIIFMVGALIGLVVFGEVGREVGTIIILVSMVFKIVECVFRFMK